MHDDRSPLDRVRSDYVPRVPPILLAPEAGVSGREPTAAAGDVAEIRSRFPRTFGRPVLEFVASGEPVERRPLRVGIVLSGGQAPGGHNVIAGLFDGLRSTHESSQVVGFLGGPRGVVDGHFRELDGAALRPYRNSGGFDLIGSGRDKIETPEQLSAAHRNCEELRLDGLVIVGGDDSNTNAAVLAEYLLERGSRVSVNGVPKTIDGDLKGPDVEASFGFDTATRVYAEAIGNICRDAKSAAKYWHFIKLMGRSASHVTLECALQTRPNVALIAEEIEERGLTLARVVSGIADTVAARAAAGRHYGVCLVPEGLLEFVPEMRDLIASLNRLLADERAAFAALGAEGERSRFVAERLSDPGRSVFAALPSAIKEQLLLDRDAHGNVQVSRIDTEKLLIEQVGAELARRQGGGFRAQGHFFGYEGRAAAPTNFDADYTCALGWLAARLVALRRTGYLCALRDLALEPGQWRPAAVPLTSMMHLETRKGRRVPVIAKALVRTDAEPFRSFAAERERWALEDAYRYPGAIQYFGPPEVTSAVTHTLRLERGVRAR